ncbi:MAG: hypothetical protein ACRDH2_04595 [Anaerolineales bacterium]
MPDLAARLREIEEKTDAALGPLEQEGQWAEALAVYQSAGGEVDALQIPKSNPAYKDAQRLRAYLYLREANALRALERYAEAEPLANRELDAAMASGDGLSIAQAMFSFGASCLANGEVERGLKFLADSKPMFEHHADVEHRQGLGWWYLIQADIRNAGLVADAPEAALGFARDALEILRPLENWSGVARAHAARAKAYERIGDEEASRVARAAGQMAAEMMRIHKSHS